MTQPQSVWFAVDADRSEWVYYKTPIRDNVNDEWYTEYGDWFPLPPGSILAITGKKLSWDDDPIEWKPTTGNIV